MGVLGVNHLAFRTTDPDGLRRFYLELTGAPSTPTVAADPDEIAFDVDSSGFEDVLGRARRLGCEIRGPIAHSPSSRGFYLSDPDGRRLEFIHDEPAVYWRE